MRRCGCSMGCCVVVVLVLLGAAVGYGCSSESNCISDEECSTGQRCNVDRGKCEPCPAHCDDRCCGDDGCGGTCAESCAGPSQICDPDSCICELCVPQCNGKCCGDDGCGGMCEDFCAGPELVCDPDSCACESCVPQCNGKCCGGDGCGGTCEDSCAGPGQVCDPGSCICEPCAPQCDGKCCGDDGCGGMCEDFCAGPGLVCDPNSCACESCVPQCNRKCCGGDGCGGTCDDSCAGPGQVCDPGSCICEPCVPQCDGKCCGDDGCGSTCQDACEGPGMVCDPPTCTCGPCVPRCEGKCCGDDGCGGTCEDSCTGPGQVCDPGSCICEPCVPQCTGKCCGDDGCGGICPDTCYLSGETCVLAACLCVPPGELGDPCPEGGLYPYAPECAAGLVCHAVPADGRIGECASGNYEDCWYSEPGVNPVCANGFCGMAFCTLPATRICGCPNGYHAEFPQYEALDGEEVICFPGNADYLGDYCSLGEINDCFPGTCSNGDCMGYFADGEFGTCSSFMDCSYIPAVFERDCVNGYCGVSACAFRPQPDGTCPDIAGRKYRIFEIQPGPRCIRAVPPASAGQPCILGDVNALWGDCAAGLACVGVPADGSYGACPGGIPDCVLVPASWNPSCTFGTDLCGGSFCAAECDGNGACPAGFESMTLGGLCYCAPASG